LVFAQNVDEINKSIRIVEGLFEVDNIAMRSKSTLKINYDDISEKIDFVTLNTVSDFYSSKRIQSIYLDDIENDSFYVEMIDLGDLKAEERGKYMATLNIKIEDESVLLVQEKLNKNEFPLPTSERTYKNQVTLNTVASLSLPLVKKVIENMAKIIGISVSKFFVYNPQTEDYDEVNDPF
jgi:hypothetical protein